MVELEIKVIDPIYVVHNMPNSYYRICCSEFSDSTAEVYFSQDELQFYVVSNKKKLGPLTKADFEALINVMGDALEMKGRYVSI